MQPFEELNTLSETIHDVLAHANRLGQVPIVIGNFSLSLMGFPVLTQDVGLFLFEGEKHAIDLAGECCVAGYTPRQEFVFRHPNQGFIQLHHRTSKGNLVQVDIMFPRNKDVLWRSLNSGARQESSKDWKLRYRIPTLADLLLLKALAGRPRDFSVIATLVAERPQQIDLHRIHRVLDQSKIIPATHRRKLLELLADIKKSRWRG